jgi:hypothetical protein
VPDPPARLIRSADDSRHGKAKAQKVSSKHKASGRSSHHKAKKRRT